MFVTAFSQNYSETMTIVRKVWVKAIHTLLTAAVWVASFSIFRLFLKHPFIHCMNCKRNDGDGRPELLRCRLTRTAAQRWTNVSSSTCEVKTGRSTVQFEIIECILSKFHALVRPQKIDGIFQRSNPELTGAVQLSSTWLCWPFSGFHKQLRMTKPPGEPISNAYFDDKIAPVALSFYLYHNWIRMLDSSVDPPSDPHPVLLMPTWQHQESCWKLWLEDRLMFPSTLLR